MKRKYLCNICKQEKSRIGGERLTGFNTSSSHREFGTTPICAKCAKARNLVLVPERFLFALMKISGVDDKVLNKALGVPENTPCDH